MSKKEISPEQIREVLREQQINSDDCKAIARRANYQLYLLFLGFLIVILTILSLQFGEGGRELRTEARDINTRKTDVVAKRGDILSANGSVISSSVTMYKVYTDLRSSQVKQDYFEANYKALADSLAAMFKDASAVAYRAKILEWRKKDGSFNRVTPAGVMVDYNELERLKTFPILDRSPYNGGAIAQVNYDRKNYYGNLAQRVIGRQETPTATGYGIELSFDDYLKGKDGLSVERKVSGSFWVPEESIENREPQDGYDIVTTIDANIQDIASSSLRQKIEDNHAIWGTAIVMEVATGKVRAMANLGRNKKGEIIEDYNHAIADNVEPGSSYKLVPLIILLEKMGVTIDREVDTGSGLEYINGIRVTDSHKGGYGVIPLKTCMSKSSNIGFARIVDEFYRDKSSEYIAAIHELGITKDIDFQLVGEAKPKVLSDTTKYWSPADLVTMSYGYATNFTAMRILMLYNAIANNGKLISPIVVDRVEREGVVKETFSHEVLNNKLCSNQTLKQVKIALEDVMYDGTVRSVFKDENYVVAGKTGTSRQVGPNGKYDNDEGMYYLASFVGYFPANDPKYTCMVQLKTLKPFGVARNYYGASLAAPVFKDISHYIASQANWGKKTASYAAQKEKELAQQIEAEVLSGNTSRHATNYDVKTKDYSQDVVPVIGYDKDIEILASELDLDDCNFRYTVTNISGREKISSNPNVMPNVMGMSLVDALSMLEERGLNVKVKGRGKVVRQSLNVGVRIKKGDEVTITLTL